jgi:hypothetical protein
MPAHAGIQVGLSSLEKTWFPTFAGMTRNSIEPRLVEFLNF